MPETLTKPRKRTRKAKGKRKGRSAKWKAFVELRRRERALNAEMDRFISLDYT